MEFENVREERQEDNMEQEEEKDMDSQFNDDSSSVIKKMKLLPEVIYATNYMQYKIIILWSNKEFFSIFRILYNFLWYYIAKMSRFFNRGDGQRS